MASEFFLGDTFEFSGPVQITLNGVAQTDLTGWSAFSQLRDSDGNLIAELDVAWLAFTPPVIQVSFAGSTQNWPIRMAFIDIEFHTPDGHRKSTQKCGISLKPDVTRVA